MGLYCCLSTVNSYVQNLKFDDSRTIPVRVRHSVYELQFLGLWLQGSFFALELAQNSLRHLHLNAGSICNPHFPYIVNDPTIISNGYNPHNLNWTASICCSIFVGAEGGWFAACRVLYQAGSATGGAAVHQFVNDDRLVIRMWCKVRCAWTFLDWKIAKLADGVLLKNLKTTHHSTFIFHWIKSLWPYGWC